LLIRAKETIPFVQATLMSTAFDRPDEVEQWRQYLQRHGIWANKPVPVFPYPGSLEYARRWGSPDEFAWQRAHDYYLKVNSEFSDIQEQMPLRLSELETTA
jgi:hypothetical protein